jgi:hypothetical protein
MDETSRINSELALILAGVALVAVGLTTTYALLYLGAFFIGFAGSQLFRDIRIILKERRLSN